MNCELEECRSTLEDLHKVAEGFRVPSPELALSCHECNSGWSLDMCMGQGVENESGKWLLTTCLLFACWGHKCKGH